MTQTTMRREWIGRASKRRERLTITTGNDDVIQLTFSQKQHDVKVSLNGLEINASLRKMNRYAREGYHELVDVLIAQGWTPPPNPDDD